MGNEVLVSVEGVSKKFCRSLKRSLWYGMRDIGRELNPFFRNGAGKESGLSHRRDGGLRPDEFWALRDVSFEVRRGECLGLIGRNGAGKTTLLKMLNGLIKPDQGRIEMRGRVGALIALGAGFNPILTGRENIYVNGSVLGLKKREIDQKIDDIIDFAEISEFIDMPVQSYSSGMMVRLGFAVATALKPDILILDEVLAVGDARFQGKCFNRVRLLQAQGVASILVSHSVQNLTRFSTSAVLLEKGRSAEGKTTITNALSSYMKAIASVEQSGHKSTHFSETGLSIKTVHINGIALEELGRIPPDLPFVVDIKCHNQISRDLEIVLDLSLKDRDGLLCYVTKGGVHCPVAIPLGLFAIRFEFDPIRSNGQNLILSFSIWSVDRLVLHAYWDDLRFSTEGCVTNHGRELIPCRVEIVSTKKLQPVLTQ